MLMAHKAFDYLFNDFL